MYTVFTSEEACHEDNLRDEKCDGAKGSGNSYAKISSHFRPGYTPSASRVSVTSVTMSRETWIVCSILFLVPSQPASIPSKTPL